MSACSESRAFFIRPRKVLMPFMFHVTMRIVLKCGNTNGGQSQVKSGSKRENIKGTSGSGLLQTVIWFISCASNFSQLKGNLNIFTRKKMLNILCQNRHPCHIQKNRNDVFLAGMHCAVVWLEGVIVPSRFRRAFDTRPQARESVGGSKRLLSNPGWIS